MIPSRQFVELDKAVHERRSFDCGRDELNSFICQSAARHREAGISITMVLPAESVQGERAGICAYYTLSHTEIKSETLPASLAKKLPRYPVPVMLIAQLAVNNEAQGQSLGKVTLIRALKHCLEINAHLPSCAVVVDALDEEVEAFYMQFGFNLLDQQGERTRLYIPMNTVSQLFT